MSTKKNVICVFSLILYLLIACTILSNWIEAQMMTKVKISERQNRGDSFGFSQSALFAGNDGDHLYEMIDGTGWSNGLRARELPSAAWYIDAHDKVQFDGSEQTYRFIVSASRQPQEGDKVAVVESFEKAEDQYLCIYTDGVPEKIILPKDAEIAVQSENVLLLNLKEAEFPFFEQTAKGLTETFSKADKIFSITEIDKFLTAIPSLALVALILLGCILLWTFACFLSIRSGDNKWLWINGVTVIALMRYLAGLLQTVELPACMLPTENIFDWQNYTGQRSLFFAALDELGITEYPCPNDAIVDQCIILVRYGSFILLSFLLLEMISYCIMEHNDKHKQ